MRVMRDRSLDDTVWRVGPGLSGVVGSFRGLAWTGDSVSWSPFGRTVGELGFFFLELFSYGDSRLNFLSTHVKKEGL